MEKLYRITVESCLLFSVSQRSARGSYGAQLEVADDNGERVRWKKVGGPMVSDEGPDEALANLSDALKHYGGVDGFRDAVEQAKAA